MICSIIKDLTNQGSMERHNRDVYDRSSNANSLYRQKPTVLCSFASGTSVPVEEPSTASKPDLCTAAKNTLFTRL